MTYLKTHLISAFNFKFSKKLKLNKFIKNENTKPQRKTSTQNLNAK